jgi:hypothetical protein
VCERVVERLEEWESAPPSRSSPVEKGNGERVSADGPDAVDLGPAVGAGIEQAGDAAEPLEQDTSSSSRDPRHGGENLDARHRSV